VLILNKICLFRGALKNNERLLMALEKDIRWFKQQFLSKIEKASEGLTGI
jgi:hypothetical protein